MPSFLTFILFRMTFCFECHLLKKASNFLPEVLQVNSWFLIYY